MSEKGMKVKYIAEQSITFYRIDVRDSKEEKEQDVPR